MPEQQQQQPQQTPGSITGWTQPGGLGQAQGGQGGMPRTGMSMLAGAVKQQQTGGAAIAQPAASTPQGGGNVADMANYLGRQYGIPIGGQGLVDESGNFLQTPKNIDEAMKFNLISDALANQQRKQYENKATAALGAEQGLLRNRQAGSLARMQSGGMRQMAGMYADTEIEPQNFDDFVAKHFADQQERIAKKMVKAAKYQMYGQMALSVAMIACWVAEVLWGPQDPRTRDARGWVFVHQDNWFVKMYIRHGVSWAQALRKVPPLKLFAWPIWRAMAWAGKRRL